MHYRVVLVEHDPGMLSTLAGVIRAEPTFDLAATYSDPQAALGQSGVLRPNLFLIDVDDWANLELLPKFVSQFAKGQVLGLMERWNADKAEAVLAAGARGSILKPFQPHDVLDALSLYERRGHNLSARTVAFFSPKGRSGSTTTAAVLAIELAKKSGEAVALIDADLQFGDLAMFFDVVPTHNVVEATHDVRLLTPATLEPYFHEIGNGLWLLAGPNRPEHAELVEAQRLIDVVRMAGSLFRYVIIDLPAGFNPISLALAEFADTDILITMLNSGQEVYHMKRSIKLFNTWETYGKKIYSLFSRVNPCTPEQQRKIEAEFGREVTGILPNERRMTAIAGSGRLMQDLSDKMPLVSSIGSLAADMVAARR